MITSLLAQDRSAEAQQRLATSGTLGIPMPLRIQLEVMIDTHRGQFDTAYRKLAAAMKANPEESDLLDALCRLLFEHGTPQDAERALWELAKRRSDDPAVRRNLGQVYLRLDRPVDAERMFQEARALEGASNLIPPSNFGSRC
jgi:Flp pilus assembly protein TadD